MIKEHSARTTICQKIPTKFKNNNLPRNVEVITSCLFLWDIVRHQKHMNYILEKFNARTTICQKIPMKCKNNNLPRNVEVIISCLFLWDIARHQKHMNYILQKFKQQLQSPSLTTYPQSARTTIWHNIPTKCKNNNLPEDGRSHYGHSFRFCETLEKYELHCRNSNSSCRGLQSPLTHKVQKQQYSRRYPQSSRTTIWQKMVEVITRRFFL